MSGLQAGSQAPVAHASSTAASQTTISRNAPAIALNGGHVSSTPGHGVRPLTSPAFELETLDYNDGSVMVPGFDQLATPGGSVDLRAQVRDSATGTYTYSWNTIRPDRRHQHQRLQHLRPHLPVGHHDLHGQGRVGHAHRHRPEPEPGQPDLHLLGAGRHRHRDRRHDLEQLDARPRPALRPTRRRSPARTSRSSRDTGALETSINLPSYNPNVARPRRSITTRWRPMRCRSSSPSIRSIPTQSHALAGLGAVDLQRHGGLDVLL